MTTLKYTLDQVRTRQVDLIGTKGPTSKAGTPWWGLNDPTTNDCVGFQLYCLGLRTAKQYTPTYYISIAAFRAHYGWNEVDRDDIRAGMLVAENWSGGTEPEHLEYVYSIDHHGKTITTISANTGPNPGVPVPRGAWKKTRPLDGHILFGIDVPYREDKPTSSRVKEVRAVAAYLNHDSVVPGDLPKTTSETDGIEGPNYWRRVQTWGRLHNLYGPTYKIDGIPGPRTRIVEAAAYTAAKKAAVK